MRFETLDDWLAWLESLHPKSIELGLDRVQQVAGRIPELSRLGPKRRAKVVTVAGTNGKGSCVATVEGLCLAAGQSVGAYTSPHFLRYNERIRINDSPATDQQIIAAFEQVEAARENTSLTYFEFGTLTALLLFVQAGVENLLLEVGLGGRLDAVNAVDPDVAVVTSVDLDHQSWLGDSREAIGREKAGIFRPDKPAICVDPDPPASVLDAAGELILAGRDLSWVETETRWTWRGLDRAGRALTLSDLPLPSLPLPSVAAGLQAFVLLGSPVNERHLAAAVATIGLPGRCQRLEYRGRVIVLDVAHNPAAAAYLAERLEPTSGQTLAVFAVMADKDSEAILRTLTAQVDRWFVGGLPDNPRAAEPEALLRCLQTLGQSGRSCDTVARAFTEALDAAEEGDRILVVGSFYTVAAVLAIIEADA